VTDHDALVRAICDRPDDDTPRLVFADFLDETGDADRAAFVRAQVQLDRTPAWEPFAVFCRHRKPEWVDGKPWDRALPPTDGWNIEWHPPPFRRGLGWRVIVRDLHAWFHHAPRLLQQAPVGELHLPPAPLDQWKQFAAGPWVDRLRVVHLHAGMIDPARVLAATHAAAGVHDVHFNRAGLAGLSFLVEELLAGAPARALRGLHFRSGPLNGPLFVEDMLDVLAAAGSDRLDRLSLVSMGMTGDLVRRLCDGPAPHALGELELWNNPLGADGVKALADGLWVPNLHTLGLSEVSPRAEGLEAVAKCEAMASLRRLDLSKNPLPPKAHRVLSQAAVLAGVRSLNLYRCNAGDKAVRHLTRAKFWPNLVELDLRANPVSAPGARHLLDAPVPPDLTALLLDGHNLDGSSRADLRRHFGDRVIL
jgi:uncharacterized protein (TIGR02996 family)